MGQPSITPALVERLWEPERGLFCDRARGDLSGPGDRLVEAGDDRLIAVSTWASLAPLALPDLPNEIGHRLVREHLLNPERYWLPVPPPSVSAEDPAFEPRDWEAWLVRRYWRGPTWINSAWLLWIGLLRLGYEEEAKRMADVLGSVVAREGLREFYEPHTGEGLGAKEFGWSSLIAELVDPEPGAAASYL